jgi:hypothetical protein
MSIRIDPTTLSVQVTTPRQTPEPPSRRFADALRQGASVVLSGISGAAGALPGMPVLTAALRGASNAAPGAASPNAVDSAEAPSAGGVDGAPSNAAGPGQSDMERVMHESQAFNLYYLEIQEEMSRENRRFSALSNVMKARHETAKSAIGNIR